MEGRNSKQAMLSMGRMRHFYAGQAEQNVLIDNCHCNWFILIKNSTAPSMVSQW
jgi:hypothetical protein